MFNVSALLLGNALKPATPLTNGANFWAILYVVVHLPLLCVASSASSFIFVEFTHSRQSSAHQTAVNHSEYEHTACRAMYAVSCVNVN